MQRNRGGRAGRGGRGGQPRVNDARPDAGPVAHADDHGSMVHALPHVFRNEQEYRAVWLRAIDTEKGENSRSISRTMPRVRVYIWTDRTKWHGRTVRLPSSDVGRLAKGSSLNVTHEGTTAQAFVTKVDIQDTVTFRFVGSAALLASSGQTKTDEDGIEYSVLECDITPTASDAIFQRQKTAVHRLADVPPNPGKGTSEYIKRIWLGHRVTAPPEATAPVRDLGLTQQQRFYRSKRLDQYQREAVETAMRNPLSIIQGPAGSGKSTCIAAYVWNTVQQGRGKVLVCAPSLSAIDQVCNYILNTGVNVVRFGSRKEDMDEFQPADQRVRHILVGNMICELNCEQGLRYRELRGREEKGETLTAEEREELDQLYMSLSTDVCSRADVVCCTVSCAGNRILDKLSFERVVIDEVTQIMEPAALIPVMKGSRQVVLVGDPLQIGPVVKSRELLLNGYQHSIVHRLIHLARCVDLCTLRVQYRMHPAIVEFPSQYFYRGQLVNGVDERFYISDLQCLAGWLDPRAPISVINVPGNEEVDEHGSFMNEGEARIVWWLIQQLWARRIASDRIGVVSPYQRQILCIKRLMYEAVTAGQVREDACENLKLGTLSSFQGTERDFVILSMVRANAKNEMGFIADPLRVNVAITRARLAFFCVANVKVISRSPVWHALCEFYRSKGLLWTFEDNMFKPCPPELISPVDGGQYGQRVEEVLDLTHAYDDHE